METKRRKLNDPGESKVCRVCSRSSREIRHDIFTEFVKLKKNKIHFDTIIFSTLQVQVTKDDTRSTKICDYCLQKVTEFYLFKEKTKKIQKSFPKEETPLMPIQSISALVKNYIQEFEVEQINVVETKDKLVVSEEVDFLTNFSIITDAITIKSEQIVEEEDDPFSNFLECDMDMKSNCSDNEENEAAATDFLIKDELLIPDIELSKEEDTSTMELASASSKDDSLDEPQERKRKNARRKIFCCNFCDKTLSDKSVYTSHINQHACIPFLLDNDHLKYVECPITLKIFANAKDLEDSTNQKLKKKSGKTYSPKKGVKSCGYCNCRYTEERQIKEHIAFQHMKYFKCPVEGCKKFKHNTYSLFYLHMQRCHPGFLVTEEAPVFVCCYCFAEYETNALLKQHRKETCTGKKFVCPTPDCGKSFGFKKLLRAHMLKEKATKEFLVTNKEQLAIVAKVKDFKTTLTCPKCSNVLKTLESWRAHCLKCCPESEVLLDDRKYFYCDYCEMKTPCVSAESFKKHQTACVKKLNTFVCNKCDTTFRNLVTLRKHMTDCCPKEVDRGTHPKCWFCLKTFFQPHQMRHHVNAHTSFKFMLEKGHITFPECQQCDAVFVTEAEIIEHSLACNKVINENIGEDKDYSCNRCNKKYKTSDLLKEHYWFKHQEQFNCPYDTCKLTYTKYGVFYFHLMTVHAGFIETITEFPCIYCDEKFANLPEVERHQRKQNACSGKKIPCTHCSKMFGSERMLNNHMLRMTNQVICAICGKSCGSNSELQDHQRCHSNEKPFKCTICTKSFNSSAKRGRHMWSHQEERNFACNQCSYRGQSYIHLSHHTRDVHTGKYSCPLCSAMVSCLRYLTEHLKKQHLLSSDDVKKIKSSMAC